MPFNSWNSSLITLQTAGPALTNTTTQTSLLNGQAKFTLPAQFMEFIGQKLRIKAAGTMSTAAAAPGTFSFFVVLGAISIYAGGASGTLATSATNAPWKLEIDLTMRAVGSSTIATAAGSGTFASAALSATTPLQLLAVPGPLTGFDSTSATLVDLQGAWSVTSASNTITCQDYELISCI